MEGEAYRGLDRQWKAACRAIFGREVGELHQYAEWLSEGLEPVDAEKSFVSGKETFAVGQYAPSSRFISFDEIDYAKKPSPLTISDIKDIDSIIAAAGERFAYAGNIVLGNSKFVEKSTGLEDCSYALHAHTNHSSQYLAYFSVGRVDRSLFGCSGTGESDFCIKTEECWKASRCLCTNRVWESADVLFSHNLRGCADCMFSFNLKGKRHVIGNVQLSPDKYREIKAKLVSELADELENRRRLPILLELVPPFPQKKAPQAKPDASSQKSENTRPVEEAFAETAQVIFGRPVGGLRSLGKYLMRHVRGVGSGPSCLSGRDVFYFDMVYDRAWAKTGRLIRQDEEAVVGKLRDWPKEVRQEELALATAGKLVGPIAYYCPEIDIQSSNMAECSSVQGAHNGFRSSRVYFSKFIAYCFWPRDSDHVFGCDSIRNSSFCINCYSSYKLARCFEADTSQNCTGSCFIHNCENVHDSMFCFNAKNLRYAIGNAEVGREEFLRARKVVLDEIVGKLAKENDFPRDIYNVVAKAKGNR